MTNKKRQELCDALRHTHPSRSMCQGAANEIERLAALAQSNAEPVAWRYRYEWMGRIRDWELSSNRCELEWMAKGYGIKIEIEPLYIAPPRPDASAGLIEAANSILKFVEDEPEYPGMQEEIKREIAAGFDWDNLKKYPIAEVAGQAIVLGCIETKKAIATKIHEFIRTRAADRSEK